MSYATARRKGVNSEANKLYPEDRAVHEWYRFVLSFPPHLVRSYLHRFGLDARHRVLALSRISHRSLRRTCDRPVAA